MEAFLYINVSFYLNKSGRGNDEGPACDGTL